MKGRIPERMPNRPKFLAFAFLFLLCVCLTHTAATPIYIDATGGDDLNGHDGSAGMPFRSFQPFCGRQWGELRQVKIVSSATGAIVPPACSFKHIDSISCATGSCSIDFGDTGNFEISPDGMRTQLTIEGAKILSSGVGPNPVLTISGGVTVVLEKLDQFSDVGRGLAAVTVGSNLTISNCEDMKIGSNSNIVSIEVRDSVLDIKRSSFKNVARFNSPFIRLDKSNALVFNSTWSEWIVQVSDASGRNGVLFDSYDSSLLFQKVRITEFDVRISANVELASLISLRYSDFIADNSDFGTSSFSPTRPEALKLASAIYLQNSTYEVTNSNFWGISSPGCNALHAQNSAGQMSDSKIFFSFVTGTPSEGASSGSIYPPFEFPSIAAVVCLTRNLSSLQADFGSVFIPDNQALNTHTFRGVTFDTNSFSTTAPEFYRRAMTDNVASYQLYASDIWASNVRLFLDDNEHTTPHPFASIRVDASQVTFRSPLGAGEVTLKGLVDFGSAIGLNSPILSLKTPSIAIYGDGPKYQVSRFTSALQGTLLLATPPFPIKSIITGGIFDTMGLVTQTGSDLTFCCTFREETRYSHGLMPFTSTMLISATTIRFEMGSRVTLARITSQIEIYHNLLVRGEILVPRLNVPDALQHTPVTIKADSVVIFDSTAEIYVVDLTIIGSIQVDTLPGATQLRLDPSLNGGYFHGLKVSQSLVCTSGSNALTLGIADIDLPLLFGPMAERPPAMNELIPILSAGALGNCIFDESNFERDYIGVFDAQGSWGSTYFRYLSWMQMDVTTSWHPTGRAIYFDFPADWRNRSSFGHANRSCENFLAVTSSADECQWETARRMRWTSKTQLRLQLNPALKEQYRPVAADPGPSRPLYLPHLNSTAVLQTVFKPAGWGSVIILDAYASTSTLASSGTTITWTSEPTNNDLDTLFGSSSDFRIGVPAAFLVAGQEYTFTATLAASWHNRHIPEAKVTTIRSDDATLALYCTHPSIRIDAATTTYYYEGTRPIFSILWDPECSTFPMPQNSISWSLNTPYSSDSIGGTAVLEMRAVAGAPMKPGDEMSLSAYVEYSSAIIRSSTIKLIYKAAEPVYSASIHYESDTSFKMSIQPRIMATSTFRTISSVAPGAVSCPIPAFSINAGSPYGDPAPGNASVSASAPWCRAPSDGAPYFPGLVVETPLSYSTVPSPHWSPNEHVLPLKFESQVSDGSTYSSTLPAEISTNQSSYLQRRSRLILQPPPADQAPIN
jgi:hypothetical protein